MRILTIMLAERSLAIIAANAAPQRLSEREARQYQHRIDLSGPPAKLGTMAEPHCHSPRGNHPPQELGRPGKISQNGMLGLLWPQRLTAPAK